jgi:alkanesulfonate monooxygenase SsuD/methylene tetrahydromethanopterin reductase-like flavin-dependent oxidoreductase (luciferase family)
VLPLRDPLWLAKQAATLDQLTDGRFTLVVAPGFWEREFAFRGLAFDQRGAAFEGGLDRLRAALAGAPEAAEPGAGASPGRVSPAPRDGGPPLWLAGGRATLRRALGRGLPFQASRLSPDALAPWAAEWHDGGGSVLAVRARMEVGDKVLEGDAVEWRALVGPPSFLAENLHAYAELGVADVSVVPSMLPDNEANSLETIEALATAMADFSS